MMSLALLLAASNPGGCPVTLTDVAAKSGLVFAHERGATPERRLPETVGAGLAWLDYDNDGWMDLYVVQSGPFPPNGSPKAQDRLFRNDHGRFVDVTAKAGLSDTRYGMGAIAADYDNDGWVDLLVTNWGGPMLLHNEGNGTFKDVTEKSGIKGPRWGTSAAWADIDGDGDLDLFIASYVDDSKDKDMFCGDPVTGHKMYCPPVMYPPSVSVMYRNNGDGTFTDISRSAGITHALGKGLGVVFADVDLDGKPDLYVANDEVMNFLFRNLGDGRFEDISVASGTAFGLEGNPQGGMGTDIGDLDGDGLPDIVVANYEGETNEYYRNLGSGVFEDLSVSSGWAGTVLTYVGFGLNLLDLDNDGNLDAFIANGHIFDNPRRQGTSYAQKPFLLWNDGKGHFRQRGCGPAFEKEFVGRGSAVADYDNDGDPDIAVSSSGGVLQLLRNDGPKTNWVGVELSGTKSNRKGIGARLVGETPSGRKLTRLVHAGNSYLSSSDPRVLFGLGAETSLKSLTIYWPLGKVQVVKNLPTGKYVVVKEE